MQIITGHEYARDTISHLSEDDAFELWCTHYDMYLKTLYHVFQVSCRENSVHWYKQIDFNTFCNYVFDNSSKYLSPWI